MDKDLQFHQCIGFIYCRIQDLFNRWHYPGFAQLDAQDIYNELQWIHTIPERSVVKNSLAKVS